MAEEARGSLSAIDPLNHFVRAEAFLASPSPGSEQDLLGSLGGEFPDQTLLELAIGYERLGLREDALSLLEAGASVGFGEKLIHQAWIAWLRQDPTLLPQGTDPAFTFPYRPETLPVLEWASEEGGSPVWSYLLALNFWALDRDDEGAVLMKSLGVALSYGPALVARAYLMEEVLGTEPTADLSRAVSLDPETRILHVHLIRHLQQLQDWEGALAWTDRAQERFPKDFNLDLLKAKSLINLDRPAEATEILSETHVLPSENARESHALWEDANLLAALDLMERDAFREAREYILAALEWPESLGQGRPYQPEERLARFLLGRAETALGNQAAAEAAYHAVVEGSGWAGGSPQALDLLTAPALEALGESPRGTAPPDMENLSETLHGQMILRALALTE
jgi:tetratricopeptide (TPR) repeat protein